MNRANSKYVVNHFLTDIKNKKSRLNHAEKCFVCFGLAGIKASCKDRNFEQSELTPYGESHLFHGDCKDIGQVNANYSAMHFPKKLLNDSRMLKNTEGNHHGTISEKYSLIP